MICDESDEYEIYDGMQYMRNLNSPLTEIGKTSGNLLHAELARPLPRNGRDSARLPAPSCC